MLTAEPWANHAPLLSRMEEIRDAVKPHRFPGGYLRQRVSETRTVKKRPGLGKALYAELSSRASQSVFMRFNSALAAADTASALERAGVGSPCNGVGANRRGGSRSRDSGKPKDASEIVFRPLQNRPLRVNVRQPKAHPVLKFRSSAYAFMIWL